MALTKKTDLALMEIGDYIPCKYTATSGVVGSFSELGTSVATEIPVTGTATPSGSFNFIKVDKGLLIADRVVQQSVSWDVLNAGKYIEGKVVVLNSKNTLIRSLNGGNSYADYSNKRIVSLVDLGLGAYPDNEWDTYIVESDLGGKIIAGDDNVWHWNNTLSSWQRETPILALGANTSRAKRGLNTGSGINTFVSIISTTVATTVGFRPVLEYLEPDAKAIDLFK